MPSALWPGTFSDKNSVTDYDLNSNTLVSNGAQMTIDYSQIFENKVSIHSGGFSAEPQSSMKIVNGSVIAENTAEKLGGGTIATAAQLTVEHSKFSDNQAGKDGDNILIADNDTSFTLTNTDMSGSIISQEGTGENYTIFQNRPWNTVKDSVEQSGFTTGKAFDETVKEAPIHQSDVVSSDNALDELLINNLADSQNNQADPVNTLPEQGTVDLYEVSAPHTSDFWEFANYPEIC
jgi:hypothetical protein